MNSKNGSSLVGSSPTLATNKLKRFTMINTGWIPGYLQTQGRMLNESLKRGGGCGGPRKDDDDDDEEEVNLLKILLYLFLFFGLIGFFFFLLCVMCG